MKFKAVPAFCAAAAVLLSGAAPPEPRWVSLNRQARQAREAKDYAKLRDTLVELRPLLPGNPRIRYLLAIAEAHLNQPAQAIGELNQLADSGLNYDLAGDEDLAALRPDSRFTALSGRMRQNLTAVSHSTVVADIATPDLLPEDLAYDSRTRRFFIASVTQAHIVFPDGKQFAKSDWPVMALRIDPVRRILWAATGWLPHCRSCNSADKDRSAVLSFDLDSGALQRRIESPVKGLLGDMTIAKSGDLYVSEGIHGAVLRLKSGAAQLERLDVPGEFPSPQTPVLSSDEQTLYVPDYVRGVAALNLRTRSIHWIDPAGGAILSGIDGFYRIHDGFLAMQNGVKPERIVRWNADFTKQEILESNSPGLGESTHGTLAGDTCYFIANTGWDQYDDDGRKTSGNPVTSQIRAIRLR